MEIKKIQTLILSSAVSFLISCAKDVKFSSHHLLIPPPTPLTQLTFDQSTVQKKVDILFVIDNSTSMRPDIELISSKFEDFISYISVSDYRIGFINTDILTPEKEEDPGFYGNLKPVGENGEIYIDSSMNNQDQLFMFAMKDQQKGSHEEKPLEAILMAIEKRYEENRDFFRDEAQFIQVIISDEDESKGNTEIIDPQKVHDKLIQEFGEKHTTSVVIGIAPTDFECANQQQLKHSPILWSYAKISSGMSVSICHPDMGKELRKVSSFVQWTLFYRDISLNPPPQDSNQIDVTVTDLLTGEILNVEWEIIDDGRNLRFISPPPSGSRIEVNYISQEDALNFNSE